MGCRAEPTGSLVTRDPTAPRPDWLAVTPDLSSPAPGTPVRLEFDLLGTGMFDGQTTLAGVDNVAVQGGGVIPAPTAVVLGLIGLAMVRIVQNKVSSLKP